jgi:hypothetical protein
VPREAPEAWRSQVAQHLDREAVADDGAGAGWTRPGRGRHCGFPVVSQYDEIASNYGAYERDLRRFRRHCVKSYVAQVGRKELLELFAMGREQGQSQKTIKKPLMAGLMALGNAGSLARLNKATGPGRWIARSKHMGRTSCRPFRRL